MICKICGSEFSGHRLRKCCSSECQRKNSDRIKRKYYDRVVVPKFKGRKPKRTIEEQRAIEKNYNNTPERKAYMKKYRKIPGVREREKESGVRYKERNPDVAKNGHLKRNYGITLDQYRELIRCQNNRCAICKKEETGVDSKKNKLKDLSVDHCHKTGKVRGLLCFKCNASLGKFEDSIELLSNAIDYLKKSKEESEDLS